MYTGPNMVFLHLFVAVLAVIGPIFAQESDVVVLTEKTFNDAIKTKSTFVKFFSPTCPHCVKLAPTFAQLAKDFKKHADKLTIAEVDCKENNKVC